MGKGIRPSMVAMHDSSRSVPIEFHEAFAKYVHVCLKHLFDLFASFNNVFTVVMYGTDLDHFAIRLSGEGVQVVFECSLLSSKITESVPILKIAIGQAIYYVVFISF